MSDFSISYDTKANVFVDPSSGQEYVSFGVGLEANRKDTIAIGEKYGFSFEDLRTANEGLINETVQYTKLEHTGKTHLLKADSKFTVDEIVTDYREDFLQRLAGLNVHYLMKI